MADWPDVDELKQVLDITSDDWDGEPVSDGSPTRLRATLDAAIEYVQVRAEGTVAAFEDKYPDGPPNSLGRAALRAAILMSLTPGDPTNVRQDAAFNRFMSGYRHDFGIA